MIPPNPLITSLVTEGINQAGEFNPSATLLARANNEWIEEIKNDIFMLAKKPKVLQVTSYTVFNKGQSRYSLPDDYSSDLTLVLLSGTNIGLSQTGGTNNITLAATDKSGTEIIGKEILIIAGVATGSYAQIVTYNPITKVAGVIPNFSTSPGIGDTYMLIDVEYPIEMRPVFNWELRDAKLITPMLPQFAYVMGDDEEGYFILNSPPDINYGARLRYYADLSQLDTASSLISTVNRRWRNIFVQGIKWKKLADENDDREEAAEQKYRKNLMNLIYRETYGMDLSNLTDKVTDYPIIGGPSGPWGGWYY